MTAITQEEESQGVSRETAEKVFNALPFDGKPGHGPYLREADHESLPEGCWSIDYEAGAICWAEGFAFEFAMIGVRVEAIRPRVVGIYPA